MIKKIVVFLIAIGVFFSLFYLLSQPPESTNNSNDSITTPTTYKFVDPYQNSLVYDNPDLIFFWGDGCPHCENVELWIKENDAENKLKINFKEIYNSESNKDELLKIVRQYCSDLLTNDGIGIPIAFDPVGQQCISGDAPIIDFLSSKLEK